MENLRQKWVKSGQFLQFLKIGRGDLPFTLLRALCSCSIQAQITLHFFLRYQFFKDIREILMNDLMNINRSLLSLNQDKLIILLLYGSEAFDNKTNFKILICTVQPIKFHTDLRIAFSKSIYSIRFC